MKIARFMIALVALSLVAESLLAQRGFGRRMGFGMDFSSMNEGPPAEFIFARLAYDGAPGQYSRWTVDYPGAERHFSSAVRRLTRIDSHPTGHVVSPDSDDLFDYPWLYAVEVGSWDFNPEQARRMREYLLKGGFLMVDDFHGEYEWQIFQNGMRKIFPDRPIEDIPEDDPLYLMPYVVGQRHQVPGPQ